MARAKSKWGFSDYHAKASKRPRRTKNHGFRDGKLRSLSGKLKKY